MGLIDKVNVEVNGSGDLLSTLSTYTTKILKPNIIDGKNILTQAMISSKNTKYVIKYDYELEEDITVPEGCVLEFDGGSLNGEATITGNNTGIEAGLVQIFTTDITLAGSWNVVEAYPEWFGAVGDGVTDDAESIQKTIDNFNSVCFNSTYLVDSNNRGNIAINVSKDNICLYSYNKATIKLASTLSISYSIIQITNAAENITISNLHLIGDKTTQTSVGEHGMGIFIAGESNNVDVNHCEIEECFGDAIYVNKAASVSITNNKLHDCRRQGISIIVAEGVNIKNNEIFNISGTNPQSGIDLEANPSDIENNRYVNNVVIENNYIHDIVSVDHTNPNNASIGKDILVSVGCKKVLIINSTCKSISMDYQVVDSGILTIDNVSCDYLLIENRIKPINKTVNIINSKIGYLGVSSTFNIIVSGCIIDTFRYLTTRYLGTNEKGDIRLYDCNIDGKTNVFNVNSKDFHRFIINNMSYKFNGGRGIKIYAEEFKITNSHFYADSQVSISDVTILEANCDSFISCGNVINLDNITLNPNNIIDLNSSKINIINDTIIGGSDANYPLCIRANSGLTDFVVANCNYRGISRNIKNDSGITGYINNIIYKNSVLQP